MPPPDEPIRHLWADEPSFWNLRPDRPRVIDAAMWLMCASAIACVLFFVIGAIITGLASEPGGMVGNVSGALALAAAPIAVWITITAALATGIRQGWRGITRAGWALTVIVLLPIGLGCGTLMSYTFTPVAASADADQEVLGRVPDLMQGTMVWSFPLAFLLALTAMVLTLASASRHYLETMAAVRGTADQRARHRTRSQRQTGGVFPPSP
jgi:hypothetical protein